ncbi:MAG: GntR family transcriptional regulator [Pseudomonadota bacterium]
MATEPTRTFSIVPVEATKELSLNDKAYALLKSEILLCRLEPGAEISEGMLAQRYALGKAPIRNALGRIRQEKFVTTRGRLGNLVAPITLQDVREVFQLRLLLEVETTRLAAGRVDEEHLRALENRVHACHASGDTSTSQAYREANHALHSYIAQASGNSRLAAMVIALIEQHERIIHFSLRVQNRDLEFHHVHDTLVDALIAGDAEKAAQIAEAAIRGSQTRIIDAFLSEAAPHRS